MFRPWDLLLLFGQRKMGFEKTENLLTCNFSDRIIGLLGLGGMKMLRRIVFSTLALLIVASVLLGAAPAALAAGRRGRKNLRECDNDR